MDPENTNQSSPAGETNPMGGGENETTRQLTPKEHRSIGPTVGLVIVLLIILLGALYYWGKQVNLRQELMEAQQAQEEEQFEEDVSALETQSSSDDLGSIEADLNSTDLDNLDAELGDLEAEVQ